MRAQREWTIDNYGVGVADDQNVVADTRIRHYDVVRGCDKKCKGSFVKFVNLLVTKIVSMV